MAEGLLRESCQTSALPLNKEDAMSRRTQSVIEMKLLGSWPATTEIFILGAQSQDNRRTSLAGERRRLRGLDS